MRSSPPKPEGSLAQVLQELRELRRLVQAPAPRLLTVEQAARYLGLAVKTVRNSLGPRAARPFPVQPVRLAGRVLFKVADLDGLIASLGGGQ